MLYTTLQIFHTPCKFFYKNLQQLDFSYDLSKALKIFHWNCHGMYSKLSDLKLLFSHPGKGCDLLGISESCLTDPLDAEISIPGYSLISKGQILF